MFKNRDLLVDEPQLQIYSEIEDGPPNEDDLFPCWAQACLESLGRPTSLEDGALPPHVWDLVFDYFDQMELEA